MMTEAEKQSALKKLRKAELAFYKGEAEVSKLSGIIQPFFEQEISVCMSTDGAVITDDSGEKGFVSAFLLSLKTE